LLHGQQEVLYPGVHDLMEHLRVVLFRVALSLVHGLLEVLLNL
jgi:hypothetical protein